MAEQESLPVARQKLVRQIGPRQLLEPVHLSFDVGKHAIEAGFSGMQRVGVRERSLQRRLGRDAGARREVARHDAAQRRDGGPPWHTVVGNVEQAAWLQAPSDEGDEGTAVLGADPAEHAVHGHDVKVRHRDVGGDVFEARFAEGHVG